MGKFWTTLPVPSTSMPNSGFQGSYLTGAPVAPITLLRTRVSAQAVFSSELVPAFYGGNAIAPLTLRVLVVPHLVGPPGDWPTSALGADDVVFSQMIWRDAAYQPADLVTPTTAAWYQWASLDGEAADSKAMRRQDETDVPEIFWAVTYMDVGSLTPDFTVNVLIRQLWEQ